MLRWICFGICFWMMAQAAFAETVTLRSRVEANGPAITLGDVFEGAPTAVAGRAIAPSPRAGQIATLSAPLLAAAASAAGLDWTPPAGVTEVRVVRPGGAAATLAPSASQAGGRVVSDAAVRRGDMVALVYEAPGLSIGTRARALEDGAIGQPVRLVNPASNRTIDAIVTGQGAARALMQ
ncbi:MAG: flagellar basal body P-ring formation protein FlgA [Hyphomonadaceae bacterium]|nr:flagellar basal body P-ring formation protein FlgA [Hyphomonadaceae bacterium]